MIVYSLIKYFFDEKESKLGTVLERLWLVKGVRSEELKMAFEKLLAIGSWKRNVHRYKDRRFHECEVGLREGKPSELKVVTRLFVLLLAMLAEGLFLFLSILIKSKNFIK